MEFFQINGIWDAWCDEVGLAGYGDKELVTVKENVFDAIKFSLNRDDIEFVEKIIEVAE